MYGLVRAKAEDKKRIRTVIPRILNECSEYLATRIPPNLTYDDIRRFYSEEQGDLDHCHGHYQLHVRTKGLGLDAGKIFFSFTEAESCFDVCVDSQHKSEGKEGIHKIIEKVKKVLNEEQILYDEQ